MLERVVWRRIGGACCGVECRVDTCGYVSEFLSEIAGPKRAGGAFIFILPGFLAYTTSHFDL